MSNIVTKNTELVSYNVNFNELVSNPILQKIVVFEHYVKKKGVDSLSRKYSISPLDLRYFLNSTEAYNIYVKERKESIDIPVVDSVEELKEFLIDKTIDFLNNCSSSQAVEIVEKFIPQILNLHASVNGPQRPDVSKLKEINYVEFEEDTSGLATSNDTYSKIQLVSTNPRIYKDEDLIQPEEINAPNESDNN